MHRYEYFKGTEARIVPTFLDDKPVNYTILDSIIGQLSDGYWENTPSMRGYWENAEIGKGLPTIHVNHNDYCPWDNFHKNPYHSMRDIEIRHFFAGRIKKIVIEELKHNYIEGIRKRFYECYGLKPDMYYVYPKKYEQDRELAEQAIKAYLEVHPYRSKGTFNDTNQTELRWLGRSESPVTVADAYMAYKNLAED